MTTAKNVNFGICLPNMSLGGDLRPETYSQLASTAERLGFHSVWVTDTLLHKQVLALDPVAQLTYALANTKRVKLGTAVLVSPLRSPILLAKMVSTLDFLSSGRIILGLALGSSESDYRACGVPLNKRVELFVQGVKVMKRLWSEESVTDSSEFWKLEGASMLPKPVQKPHPPILFGGGAEGVLRRAGKLADGWLAGSRMTPQTFSQSWQKILSFAESSRRDPSKLQSAKLFYVHVDKSKDAARAMVTERMNMYYGSYDVEKFVLFGSKQDCYERTMQYTEVGVETFILVPIDPTVEQLETIADDLVSRF